MQLAAAGSALVNARPQPIDNLKRPDLDLGQDAAANRGPSERAADQAQSDEAGQTAGQARADQVRTAQAQTAQAIEAVSRTNTPEAPSNALSERGGEGSLRGSRVDISV